MNANSKKKNYEKDRERAVQLVRALVDENTDPELHTQLLLWFLALREGSVGEKASAEFAADIIQPNLNPDKREFDRFRELQRRLGTKATGGQRRPKAKKPQTTRIVLRAAAVLIPFFVIVGTVWFGQDIGHVQDVPALAVTEIEAYEGVQKDVCLPDSTHVWLNSGSRLTFPERFADARSVTLEGEAYFDVRHDDRKPFVVHTEYIDVRVLGTRFDVAACPGSDTAEVELFEGSVAVIRGTETLKVLVPGERLVYHKETGQFTVTAQGVTTDWRSEVVYAKDRTLPQLFRMIGNYYDVEIVYDETDFAQEDMYDSAFGRDYTGENIINSLSLLSGIFTYSVRDGKIIIEKRKTTG